MNKNLGSYHWQEITREMVLAAIAKTKSNSEAARYLGIAKQTWKKHASLYTDDQGRNCYEAHNNKYCMGLTRKAVSDQKTSQILDILSGKTSPTLYDPQKLKRKIIAEGFLHERCSNCGFNEARVSDLKVPLILIFRDGNKKNWDLENISLYCYNCHFNYIGEVFTKKQLDVLEGITNPKGAKIQQQLELSDVHMKALEDILTNKLQRDTGHFGLDENDLVDSH